MTLAPMNRDELLAARLGTLAEFVADAKGKLKAGKGLKKNGPTNGASSAIRPHGLVAGSEQWYLLADIARRLPAAYGALVLEAVWVRDVSETCRWALRVLEKSKREAVCIPPRRRTPQQKMLVRGEVA